MNKIIPCERNRDFQQSIEEYAEALKAEAHRIGTHGLSEQEFIDSGLLRGAIEQIRGEYSATMRAKREFGGHILDYMQDRNYIVSWESAAEANRYDYMVQLPHKRIAAIELKGCLDGNNTNIFERPQQAHEFVIWSVCTNPGADPEHNAWSGIHTRLSAELITRQQRLDGLIVWDMLCGAPTRPCPKSAGQPERRTTVAHYQPPPPCIYVFPGTTPHARNNPHPTAQALGDVALLKAFHQCFGGGDDEVNYVDFDVEYRGSDVVRRTRVRRNDLIMRESRLTAIRRTE